MSDVHVHEGTHGAFVVGQLICVDDIPVAIVTNPTIAARVAELLSRFGLVDVPDMPPQLPPPDLSTWAGQNLEGPR